MGLRNGLLVFGNVNIDRIYTITNIPEVGQSVSIGSERTVFGGCAGNIAIAAARAGVDVDLSSVIGMEFPIEYSRRLEEAGIDLKSLMISEELPSPYCIVLSAPEGRQIYAFNLGSMAEQKDMEVPLSRAARFVHIATSDPDFSIRASRELLEMGCSISIDPGMEIYKRWSKDQLERVLPNCERFFGNLGEWEHLGKLLDWERELIVIEGIEIPLYKDAFDYIEEAVVTLGSSGSILLTSSGYYHETKIDVGEVIDATGAGDAFRGGFYAALIKGYSSDEALRYGNALGALSIRSEGPQDYTASWNKIQSMI